MERQSDTLISQINLTARRLQNRLNDLLKPLNLTVNNYYFILKINVNEPLTQDQLYKQIYLSHSNVTRRLDQLIQLGLVKKTPDKVDGRTWQVALTQAGKALVPQIEAVIQQINQRAFSDLSKASQELLRKTLENIDAKLD